MVSTYLQIIFMTLRDDKIFQAKDELPQNRLTDSMILGACVDDDGDGAC